MAKNKFEDYFEEDYFFGFGKSNYWNYDIQKRLDPKYARLVSKYINSGKILDVGCGDGYFLNSLPDSFDKCGLDISKFMIRRCNGFKCTTHDIEKPLTNWGKFDCITAFNCIEHIPNIGLVLTNIKHLLRPDGYFIVSVPHLNLFSLLFDRDTTHFHLMRLNTWKTLLEKWFSIVEVRKNLWGSWMIMKNG